MRNPFPHDPSLTDALLAWTRYRISTTPSAKYGAKTAAELDAAFGDAISSKGLGGEEGLRLFVDEIIPTIRAQGHPTNLAYVPAAPSPAALAFDAALGSSEIFGGTWESGSGAIHAENQALAWLAECAGFPDTAGGVFVSGGTVGNLSALHAARAKKRKTNTANRLTLLASSEAHSSIKAVANVMDVHLEILPVDDSGEMDLDALAQVDTTNVFAIVANAGATNSGAVDNISALADFANAHDIWLHLDGAYGLAALACPTSRKVFAGIERADSFIVDPHKWLFAPYDVCALVYRDPSKGAEAHAQRAVYLDPINNKDNWNPTDYAMHLSRRARGLPLWFSLVTYGSDAYADAVFQTIETANKIGDWIDAQAEFDLSVRSKLSVLLFRPIGISDEALDDWADRCREAGSILCMPTTWNGQKHLRICVVNPLTDPDVIIKALSSLIS
jgi:glutamate/tyrosine decarboxylase-like PLP-dependent enzyme